MLLEVASAQFARGDRRSVTYMVLERCVRARSRANREERVIEQQQAKHETNCPPRQTYVTVCGLLGDDIAHSLHFIIDATNTDFALPSSLHSMNTREPRQLLPRHLCRGRACSARMLRLASKHATRFPRCKTLVRSRHVREALRALARQSRRKRLHIRQNC